MTNEKKEIKDFKHWFSTIYDNPKKIKPRKKGKKKPLDEAIEQVRREIENNSAKS